MNNTEIKNIIFNTLLNYTNALNEIKKYNSENLKPYFENIDNLILNKSIYLTESRGLFPLYNEVIKSLFKTLSKEIKNVQPTKDKKYGFDIYEVSFTKNLKNVFFTNINLTVKLIHIDKKYKKYIPNLTGGKYSGDIEIKNNKINSINIFVQCPYIDDYETIFKSCLMHELTHAYQDLNLHINKGKNNTIMTSNEYVDQVYGKYIDYYSNGENTGIRLIGNIFYLLSKTEQNAMVAQTYQQLKNIPYEELRYGDSETIIQKLPMWNEFNDIDNQLAALRTYLYDEEYGEICLKKANDLLYNKKSFKTVNELYKWLLNQISIAKSNVINKVGMVIKQYKIDNYQIEEKIIL